MYKASHAATFGTAGVAVSLAIAAANGFVNGGTHGRFIDFFGVDAGVAVGGRASAVFEAGETFAGGDARVVVGVAIAATNGFVFFGTGFARVYLGGVDALNSP